MATFTTSAVRVQVIGKFNKPTISAARIQILFDPDAVLSTDLRISGIFSETILTKNLENVRLSGNFVETITTNYLEDARVSSTFLEVLWLQGGEERRRRPLYMVQFG